METLFPTYLNSGSVGPAVAALQLLLRGLGYQIRVDGIYGPDTEKWVRNLQERLFVDQDGHFGPATRRALCDALGIDVDDVHASVFQGKAYTVIPETVQPSLPLACACVGATAR